MERKSGEVKDPAGNAIAGASVYVLNAANALATIYADNGVTPLANPIVTGLDGEYGFYAANGRYSLSISAPGYPSDTVPGVVLYDRADDTGAEIAAAASLTHSQASAESALEALGHAEAAENALRGAAIVCAHWWPNFGVTPAATTAAINEACDYVGQRGGGTVLLPAGTIWLTNTNAGAASWDNWRAIWLRHNGVKLRGAGRGVTVLKLVDGANCHVIKIGQRASGTLIVTDCGVSDLSIDGNRATQIAPTAADYHQSGIDVSSGCSRTVLERLHIYQTGYYGIGFERDGYRDCTVHDVILEDTGADGIDCKDDSGTSSGNAINKIRVRRFGLAGALTMQGGVNFRGGWDVSDVEVTEYSGSNHGIRFDPSTAGVPIPSKLRGFHCAPSAKDSTIGVYVNLDAATENLCVISDGYVSGVDVGISLRGRFGQAVNITARDCNTGFRAYKDCKLSNVTARECGTGYKVNESTNLFINASAYNCTVGADIDAASTLTSFRGGVFSGCTTKVIDAGTQTAFQGVSGINTHGTGSASVPIDSTGTKVVTVPHNLDFVPNLDDVVLSLKRSTNVGDFSLGFIWVYNADATNVYCNVRVLTASATAGATVTLVATCVAKKALRQ